MANTHLACFLRLVAAFDPCILCFQDIACYKDDLVVCTNTLYESHLPTKDLMQKCNYVLSFLPPAPFDYTTVTMDLTFNADYTNQIVMIHILGDNVVENTESFTVSLTTGDSAVMLTPQTATVTIQDDDSKI